MYLSNEKVDALRVDELDDRRVGFAPDVDGPHISTRGRHRADLAEVSCRRKVGDQHLGGGGPGGRRCCRSSHCNRQNNTFMRSQEAHLTAWPVGQYLTKNAFFCLNGMLKQRHLRILAKKAIVVLVAHKEPQS